MGDLLTAESFDSTLWNDWRWQMSNSIRSVDALRQWVRLTEDELGAIEATSDRYRWRVTPYYASLMDPDNPSCPIRRQAIPHRSETLSFENAEVDPVGDMYYRKTNRVIHKYPDRVVLLVTQNCPVYCRHCTRKYHTTDKTGTYFREKEGLPYDEDIAYIAKHPAIRDVLLTGGDPLSYQDAKLEPIIRRLRAIPHVEIIRIGSRYPVLLPQRITPALCDMLDRYQPIWFSTHFNHPKELTAEAAAACGRLLNRGIPVQNQTVLLRGINDDVETMRELVRALVRARVRPYYLYHCDNVAGVSHFMTTLEKGREIMAGLLGHVTGFALPRYIITTRLGKIPLERSYVIQDDGKLLLENFRGEKVVLPGEASEVPGGC